MPATNQPTSPTNNQTPVKMASIKNNKNLIIIILLILLVVLGATYYFLSIRSTSDRLETPIQQPQKTLSEQEIEESINSVEPMEQDLDVEFSEAIRPPVDEGANLMLGSNQKIYQVGDEFSATLLVNTKVVPDGIEFEINYDPTMLTNVSTKSINGFGNFLGQKVKADEGKIVGIFLRDPGEEVNISQALPLLIITGTTTKAGQLSLNFDAEATMVAAAGGQEVLENSYDLMVEVK